MKRYVDLLKTIIAPAAGLAFALVFTACTDVDDNLGNEWIPDDQTMKVAITELSSGINTYVVSSDSLYSSYTRKIVLGNMVDPVMGKISAGSIFMFYPYDFEFNDGNLYGFRPVADSMTITLYYNEFYGKDDVEQKFYIYPLKDTLDQTGIFTNDFPLEEYVDLDNPLFSFTTKNEMSLETKTLEVLGEEGEKYLQSIVETDSVMLIKPDKEFRKRFPGLYVAPAPDSPEDAAIYNVNLLSTVSGSTVYSLFTMHFHNHKRQPDSSGTYPKDTTTYTYYVFDHGDFSWPNMTVNKVDFEYPPQIQAIINDTDNPQPEVYIQGLRGLSTRLEFTDELVKELQQLRFHNGIEYSGIVINQAMLYIALDEHTAEVYDEAASRIGMYEDYKGYAPSPIADYLYTAESYSTLPYNGYLNRSHGYYEMNISVYISYLIKNPDEVPRAIYLGHPMVDTGTSSYYPFYVVMPTYSQVKLKGSESDEPLRLKITYTLAK